MKKLFYIIVVFVIFPRSALAGENVKLPYAAGERFIVTTGYDTPPTHIKKDSYAIDFAQDGCDAYGKAAIAALSGTAQIVEEGGYNGGYGTQLLILARGNVVARYAHLIPGSIPVAPGDAVPQGTIVGEIGDTGLVAGTACAEHPGTHIHFAMDVENADGSFSAKDPEPISGYTGIVAGKWYVSDSALAVTEGNLASLVEILKNLLGSSVTVAMPSGLASVSKNASSSVSPPVSEPGRSAVPSTSFATPVVSPSPPFSTSLSSVSSSPGGAVSISNSSASVSVGIVPSGGGSGPGGGVLVIPATISSGTSVATATSSTNSSSDDPSDDTVEACE